MSCGGCSVARRTKSELKSSANARRGKPRDWAMAHASPHPNEERKRDGQTFFHDPRWQTLKGVLMVWLKQTKELPLNDPTASICERIRPGDYAMFLFTFDQKTG